MPHPNEPALERNAGYPPGTRLSDVDKGEADISFEEKRAQDHADAIERAADTDWQDQEGQE